MWQARPPADNLPKAMVDFVQTLSSCIKDPSLLKPMIDAAEKIDELNTINEEMADKVTKAQDTIALASDLANKLADDRARLDSDKKDHGVALAKIADREIQCDQRNSLLSDLEKALADRIAAIEENEHNVSSREAACRAQEDQNNFTAQGLALREQRVAVRETALQDAAALVSRV